MAYDEKAAERVSDFTLAWDNLDERHMFGGVGWLLNGNMCVGVWKEFLILRVGKEQDEALKTQPHIKDFDITGTPMRGWVMVGPEAYDDDADLEDYLQLAHDYVMTLPPKQK